MAGIRIAPTEADLNRTPLAVELAEKDPDQTRTLQWRPQKVSAMMFGAGLLDGSDLLDGDDEAAQAKAGTKATRAMIDWFGGGLSDQDEEYVIGRLKDPDDWLDFTHLTSMIKQLIGVVSGDRPTGSR